MNDYKNIWIEWIPNVSTANKNLVEEIRLLFSNITNLYLLHTDRSPEVNRTVFTLVGNPDSLQKALFALMRYLNKNVNMAAHTGSHPRIGALDVSPYVLLQNKISDVVIDWVRKMAQIISHKFNFPVYFYEYSASHTDRINLSDIRRGEYEGLSKKLQDPDWKPDFGNIFNSRLGATVMGVRDFLIAYNVNLDTRNVNIAKKIAAQIREKGRPDRVYQLPGVKAIGWYLQDSKFCQVSTNITQTKKITPLDVYDRCREMADKYGCTVTGSELIGLIPYHSVLAMLTEGPYNTTSLAGYLGLQYCGIHDLRDRIIEHKAYIASGNLLFKELFQDK